MKHVNESNATDAVEAGPVSGLAGLKSERLPATDLWPGIESRIQAQRVRRWNLPLWTAAALAASLALVLGLAVEQDGPRGEAPLHAPASVAASRLGLASDDPRLVPVANRPMHAETRALVRANLKIVSSAEREIRMALERDPHGEYLRSLLAAAQDQKQELRVALSSDR